MEKCYLVTGATGFLGSHIVRRLIAEHQKIVILKRSFSNTYRIEHEMGNLISYDIDDKTVDIAQVFHDQHIDAVIHTATCYGRGGENSRQVVATNLDFPLMLLENASLFKVDVFVNTDTTLPQELNSYSLSKKQFSDWGKLFARNDHIRFIDVTLEHIYGEDDNKSKFVTFLFESMWRGVPEINLTKGEQKRDFVYVEDVVEAYWQILQHQEEGESFQCYEIGSGETIAIKNLALKIKKILHSETKLNFGAIPYRVGEVMESRTDISKIKSLGWKPSVDINNGILKMIEYKEKY